MKRTALIVALLLSFGLTMSANDAVLKMAKYTHRIRESVISGGSTCSATAIGPHALLTASHCEQPTDEVQIDEEDDTVKIIKIIRDGNDHTIFLVSDDFKDYAKFGAAISLGDKVRIIGNPHGKLGVYREGVVANIEEAEEGSPFTKSKPETIWFDLNVFEGDSGSAILNDRGEIVGVLSFQVPAPEGDQGKMAGAFSLAFTPKQLAEALKFVPPVTPKESK